MTDRESRIVDCLEQAFAGLMKADPDAFRTKFRKMAADPFAFYRGSACVFYADVADQEDRWADERTGRVWIQGDLHAENFGTYMDGAGMLIFDVNDFDEAFVGHFTWDLQRFAASVALLCWQKALSDNVIRDLIAAFIRSYLDQVTWFRQTDDDSTFSLNLDTARGAVLAALQDARLSTRYEMLHRITHVDDADRRFRHTSGVRELDEAEYEKVKAEIEEVPRNRLRRQGHRRANRLRHRQRGPTELQRADRGLQPGARQRHRAVDEAGQRRRGEPGRRRRGRAQVLQEPGAPHRGIAAGVAGVRRSPARPHRDRRGRFRRRGALAVRVRPGLDRTDRTRRADRGDRTARPCGGQGALCR